MLPIWLQARSRFVSLVRPESADMLPIWFELRASQVRLVRSESGDMLPIWFEDSHSRVRLVHDSSPVSSMMLKLPALSVVIPTRSDW